MVAGVMNAKTIGLLRELLTALAAALMAYGYGSDSLWETATGGIVAAIMLGWGLIHNEGPEAWYSLARKVISSVAGVLVITGTLQPDKAQVIIGVVMSTMAMLWSAAGKDVSGDPPAPPAVPLLLLLLAGASFMLPGCAGYPITGTVYLRDPSSGAKGGLTFTPGEAPKATIKIPIYDEKTGELIGMADLSSEIPSIDRTSGK